MSVLKLKKIAEDMPQYLRSTLLLYYWTREIRTTIFQIRRIRHKRFCMYIYTKSAAPEDIHEAIDGGDEGPRELVEKRQTQEGCHPPAVQAHTHHPSSLSMSFTELGICVTGWYNQHNTPCSVHEAELPGPARGLGTWIDTMRKPLPRSLLSRSLVDACNNER